MIDTLLAQFQKSHQVCTDTRTVQPGDLFFALKGDRFDGNQFAQQALDAGASLAVVDDPSVATDDRFVLVENVLQALQQLATAYRRTLPAVVIALTGSNGKTTTKELMHAVLAQQYITQSTPGNFNNHIGVPLTLLSLKPETEMAIIEMGANHQREIALLASIAEPDYGLITNIGDAHLEGFGGREGVRKGKGELFDYLRENAGTALVNTDLEHLEELAEGIEVIQYSMAETDLNLRANPDELSLHFKWDSPSGTQHVTSAMTGAYNLPNFAAAIAVGLNFDISAQLITEALSAYRPTNQRSEIVITDQNRIILDAYNANPSSMDAALRNLASMKDNTFFIIGDMLELGEETRSAHQRAIDLAVELGLDGWVVGETFAETPGPFPHFPDAESVRHKLESAPLSGKLILVKGSRGIRLEEVVDRL